MMKWERSKQIFLEKVINLHGNKFIILTNYISRTDPIGVHCTDCKNTFTTMPRYLLTKSYHGKPSCGCPFCAHKNTGLNSRKKHEDFVKEIYKINPLIEILGYYTTGNTKLDVKCLKCNFVWKVCPSNLGRRGCPNCPKSKAELKIEELLKKADINFERQVWFKGLKGVGGGTLRFDFGIYEQGKLLYLIEYDGWQHFKADKSRGGEDKLKITQQNDTIKNNYCGKHQIPLIRLKNLPTYKITLSDITLEDL